MKYGDEISKLAKAAVAQRESGKTDSATSEIIEGLLTLVKKLSEDYEALESRVQQSEEFSETLSMDMFDIQSLLLKKHNDGKADISENNGTADALRHNSKCHDENCGCEDEENDDSAEEQNLEDIDDDEDEEDGASFVRCPFCNTLIFADETVKEFKCPFCEEKFTRDDIENN